MLPVRAWGDLLETKVIPEGKARVSRGAFGWPGGPPRSRSDSGILFFDKMFENSALLHGLGPAWKLKPDGPDEADEAEMVHGRHWGP